MHVYLLNTDAKFIDSVTQKYLYSLLSNYEKNVANNFYFDYLRVRYIVRRGMLRCLLSQNVSIPPKAIKIELGEYGKPYLNTKSNSCYFNLSHSYNHTAIVIANVEVGIDIEKKRNNFSSWAAIAKDVFSYEEQNILFSYPHKERLTHFFNLWVRKEAYIKSIGKGLSYPLQSFTVPSSLSLGNLGAVKILNNDNFYKNKPWNIYSLSAHPGYCCAISSQLCNIDLNIANVNKQFFNHYLSF